MAEIKGGNKLSRALEKMASALGSSRTTVRVGFLENATYPGGKGKRALPVAMIAAIQNYGSGFIPARPFFSNMVKDKSPGWPRAIELNLKASNYDAQKTMKLVGEGVAGQLRQSIIETNSPPLAASTLRARGYHGKAYNPKDPKTFGAKPLVDTGHMLGSVDLEVKG